MATTLEVSYFNTFWLKRLKNINQYQQRDGDGTIPVPPALVAGQLGGGITTGTPDPLTGEGYVISNDVSSTEVPGSANIFEDWYIEESRIKGGFNNISVDFGVKAYIVEEEANQTRRQSSLIYSGVYNAKNGINNTNEFPIGEEISRSVDPASGSIQKLYAENTNLVIFQERKVNRAPIDKDVIFTQEGQPLSANSVNQFGQPVVIGTPTAFEGNFGISRDPGSFAVYGYNKYFTDRDRSVVMQLGINGLTEISNFGMIDYFRDSLNTAGEITGGYDVYNKNYVLTINDIEKPTVVFDDLINGWVSFMSYVPELSTSLRGNYYTFKNNGLWKHNVVGEYNLFYQNPVRSSVEFVFNPQPTITKTFKTIDYTGSNGWEVVSLVSDYTGTDTNPQQPILGDTTHVDFASPILSYDEGYYIDPNSNIQYRAGFDRKQNNYYASIKNDSQTLAEEVITPGRLSSGIKGQYAIVTFKNDNTTDPRGAKQLFSVGTEFNNR